MVVAVLAVDPALGALAAVAAFAWPHLRRARDARAGARAVEAALPDAIEVLVLVVHAGMTPSQAVDLLVTHAPAAVRPGFAEVRRRSERGATLADALPGLADVLGPPAMVVADTLAMAERHGNPLGPALEQLGRDVRERRRRRAEAEARTLPVRLSFPLVCCVLPSFVLVAIVPAVLGALSSLGDTGFSP